MKIAQIAPLYEAVPPSLYGGTERIVAHLTNALVELGHEVTLFASAEAHTRATLVPVRDQAIRLDRFPLKSDLAAHLSMLHELHLRRHEFDLLHFLLSNPNVPIPPTKLLQAVWGPDYGDQVEYLRVFVGQLRKKLEPDASSPRYIVTEPWVGYRFEPGE